MIKKCVICGKEFDTNDRGTNHAVTCSKECTIENQKIKSREYHRQQKLMRPRTKKGKQTHADFVEINAKAHALGMSYGQYVGLYMNGEQNGGGENDNK